MNHDINHFGLGFLVETDDDLKQLWEYIITHGKEIKGYYGYPYINCHFGDVQLILRTTYNAQEKRFEVVDMDVHAAGSCVWQVKLSDININRKNADVLSRRCVVKTQADEGIAVVNIINADVLPSFMENEAIRLQMIAFPESIAYFTDEEAYAADQPTAEDGSKWLLADGAVFPSGLLHNRNPQSAAFESDEDADDLALIKGKVKKIYPGTFELDGEKYHTFLYCVIETQFGDLEIVHTIEEVAESQRKSITEGAVVYGLFKLSGDVAIYEYDQGIVLDKTKNLSVLQSVFSGEDAERLRYVLAENAVYLAEYNNTAYKGKNAIISRLNDVKSASDTHYFAHDAVIGNVKTGDDPLPYTAGERCIVIASGNEDNYQTIAFVEVDQDGFISKIRTSENSRYQFRIENKTELNKKQGE